MRSRLELRINAPLERIYPLASEVERWPERLPHYRYVRRLPSANGERRFAMGARRGWIPVAWQASQRLLPAERRIEFTHTWGVTRCMQVAWRFEPRGHGLGGRIEHRIRSRCPIMRGYP